MYENLDVEAGPKHIFPEKVVRSRFLNRVFQDGRSMRKLAPDIDVGGVNVERETGDQNSFEQLMGIFMNNVTILKRAWLRFVGITDQVNRPLFVRFDEAPFNAAGKSGAAAAAESRDFHFVDDVLSGHRDRFAQFFVTAIL